MLAEPPPSVDEGGHRSLPREHRTGRRDEKAPVGVTDVLRDADDAVGVVTGEVGADQVPRQLRRHVSVRPHAPGDGGNELVEGIGRTEHRGFRIGHEPASVRK